MTELVMKLEYVDSTLFLQPSPGVGDDTEKINLSFRQAANQIHGESIVISTWANAGAKLRKEISDPVLLKNALLFADAMPYWVPCSEIDIYEDDSEVIFEWFCDTRNLVNALISSDGNVYFSAQFGPNSRVTGADPVNEGISQHLIRAIKRVFAHNND